MRYRQTNSRQRDIHVDRQADKQIGKQTGRQTDTQKAVTVPYTFKQLVLLRHLSAFLLSCYVLITPHRTPHVPGGMSNTPSTTANLMEVILPSCDCGDDTKGNRTPRFLRSEDVITLQTTTTLTLDKVISATAPTTVSITYNGCVPLDAISTNPCLTSTTSTTTSTSS